MAMPGFRWEILIGKRCEYEHWICYCVRLVSHSNFEIHNVFSKTGPVYTRNYIIHCFKVTLYNDAWLTMAKWNPHGKFTPRRHIQQRPFLFLSPFKVYTHIQSNTSVATSCGQTAWMTFQIRNFTFFREQNHCILTTRLASTPVPLIEVQVWSPMPWKTVVLIIVVVRLFMKQKKTAVGAFLIRINIP